MFRNETHSGIFSPLFSKKKKKVAAERQPHFPPTVCRQQRCGSAQFSTRTGNLLEVISTLDGLLGGYESLAKESLYFNPGPPCRMMQRTARYITRRMLQQQKCPLRASTFHCAARTHSAQERQHFRTSYHNATEENKETHPHLPTGGRL